MIDGWEVAPTSPRTAAITHATRLATAIDDRTIRGATVRISAWATFSIPAPQNSHSPPPACEKYWPCPFTSAEMPSPFTVHPDTKVLLPSLATMATDWTIKLISTQVFIVTNVPRQCHTREGYSKL